MKIVWCSLQLIVAICTMLIFFAWAPRLAAEPVTNKEIAAQLPPGCPAYYNNHGQIHCAWNGSLADDPAGFRLLSAGLIGGLSFLYFTGFTGRGFQIMRRKKGNA